MKTSVLPPLRVAPALRDEAERLLREGETLSSFMLDAVQQRVRERALEEEFIQRGLASRDEARRTGAYLSAGSVVSGLRARLTKARKAKTIRAKSRSRR